MKEVVEYWKCLDCGHKNHGSWLNCEKCSSFNGEPVKKQSGQG